MRFIAVLAAGLLAGCATVPQASVSAPQSVAFEVTPCFGSCPDFSITLTAGGTGTYTGRNFVKTKGTHKFTATQDQVQAFFKRIAPYRPEGEVKYDYEHCPVPVSTDSPSVNVRWTAADGDDALNWYRGCRAPELMDLKPDLYDAWKELPLDDLVGTAENRFQYQQQGS